MKKIMFQDVCPIQIMELPKSETSHASADDIIGALKLNIRNEGRAPGEEEGKAAYIGVFDHLDHTMGLGGEIAQGMREVKNLIFCFGYVLPQPQMLAVRPRSIGVADMGANLS